MSTKGWIGVDLDGTLAHYDGWQGVDHIGEPVPAMLARVKAWLAEGREVRILTARVCSRQKPEDRMAALLAIQAWCSRHVGMVLGVVAEKDYGMVELWDDRCVQVIPNTGRPLAVDVEDQRLLRADLRAHFNELADRYGIQVALASILSGLTPDRAMRPDPRLDVPMVEASGPHKVEIRTPLPAILAPEPPVFLCPHGWERESGLCLVCQVAAGAR